MEISKVLLTDFEMINIHGGSVISLKKRALEFFVEIGKNILEDEVTEAWNCFWDSFI